MERGVNNDQSNHIKDFMNYQDLCIYCFDVLVNHLTNSNEFVLFPESFKSKSFPLFVTWTIGADKDLRGCIGTFAEEKLEINLKKYALVSALKDSRFRPISLKELNDLHVGVSLLTFFEDCSSPLDWEVGKHGIEIDFEHKSRSYGATFLPEVAHEQGWDQKQTLKFLVNKSGYSGKIDSVFEKINAKRYQSIKTHLSYEEYKTMRKIEKLI